MSVAGHVSAITDADNSSETGFDYLAAEPKRYMSLRTLYVKDATSTQPISRAGRHTMFDIFSSGETTHHDLPIDTYTKEPFRP